jgi:hypothetical protein
MRDQEYEGKELSEIKFGDPDSVSQVGGSEASGATSNNASRVTRNPGPRSARSDGRSDRGAATTAGSEADDDDSQGRPGPKRSGIDGWMSEIDDESAGHTGNGSVDKWMADANDLLMNAKVSIRKGFTTKQKHSEWLSKLRGQENALDARGQNLPPGYEEEWEPKQQEIEVLLDDHQKWPFPKSAQRLDERTDNLKAKGKLGCRSGNKKDVPSDAEDANDDMDYESNREDSEARLRSPGLPRSPDYRNQPAKANRQGKSKRGLSAQ